MVATVIAAKFHPKLYVWYRMSTRLPTTEYTQTHQDTAHQGDFESGWHNTEDNCLKDKRDTPRVGCEYCFTQRVAHDALGSPVDCSGETPSLPRQVELEVEVQEVLKCLSCNLADSTLADIGKYRVQKLPKERGTDSRSTVWNVRQCVFTQCSMIRSHPRIREPATTQTVESSVTGMFKESIMFLKSNGTCTFNT